MFKATLANGSLNLDLFFLDNVHLVKKGNQKLAKSIFSSIGNCNCVTSINSFFVSYKMAVPFKLNNFNFPLYLFLPHLNLFPLFLFCYHFLLHVGLPVMLVLSPINLSLILPTSDGAVCSSNVYPSQPISPNKPVCLSNAHPSIPIISSNFYVSKPVSPRNVSSSRSICSSDACQRRSNVSPSKPVHSRDVCPSKAVRPRNAWSSKTAHSSKVYCSKPACPSNTCPNRPVG